MNLAIHAVGKLKRGPEQDLCARYLDRLAKAAPPLGLTWHGTTERMESRNAGADGRKAEEGSLLGDHLDRLPGPVGLVLLDERGTAMASQRLADMIADYRDTGMRSLCFAIGGPDGHGDAIRARADRMLAFGPATWPHQLARVMLAEQLYRAVTILSGHPYHRS